MSKYVERHEEIISDDGFLRRVKETVTVKLKTCPFCGGKAGSDTAQNEDMEEKRIIKCSECGAMTELFDELEGAVDAWNRRV